MEATPDPAPISSPPTHKRKLLTTVVMLIIVSLVGLGLYWSSRASAPAPTKSQKAATTTTATSPKIQLALFASGLPNPTGIVSTGQSSDNRLFVLDESGVIRIVDPSGTVTSKPFLDISSQVMFSGEMGLLGLAFSPHYAQDGYFFVDYIDKNQETVVARYHVSSDPNVADPTSGQTLLTLKQPYPNHKAGDITFGPDGYLYVPLGDGGSAGDPDNRAQNLSMLFGKILRLDVSQVPYKIPPSNPFVKQAGALPEIWDYGLRNPWRISFDRQTGDLYIADVGQGNYEELDVEATDSKGGNNYGWRCYEGNASFNPIGCQAKSNYVFPVLTYDHTQNRCALIGGYVYRGSKYPSLNGKYFYGDYCGGQVYWTDKAANWQPTLAVKTPYMLSTFGQDNQGELYLADYTAGTIYQLQTVAN